MPFFCDAIYTESKFTLIYHFNIHVNVIQSGLEGGKVTRFRSPSKKMRVNEANKESESLQ